jgi:general secretion pathway protein A
MYKKHFGLTYPPFSIAPDPRYLYMSDQHREALAHLVYGVTTDGGFVLLTGEVGAGKTTICRCLLEQVPEETDIAFIINPRVTVDELLASICDEIGVRYPEGTTSNKVFIDGINDYLLDAHARGRKTVIVIEEAQNLSAEVLEQVRLLTNLETNERKLLQIIMLGQPELRDMLARPDLQQLSQRITARYHLGPLSEKEVDPYVAHRLAIAGVSKRLFSPPAIRLLYRLSGGVPRLINLLCDRALLGAYVQDKSGVTRSTLRKAAAEVFGRSPLFRNWSPLRIALVIMLVISCGATLAVFYARGAFTALAPVSHMPAVSARPTPAVQPPPAQKLDTLERPVGLSQKQSRQDAYGVLMSSWGLAIGMGEIDEACQAIEQKGMQCLDSTGTLDMLRRLNRPAVLKLQDDKGKEYYGTLTAMNAETALVHVGSEKRKVPVSEIEKYWFGDFTMVWRVPAEYRGAIKPGDRGPAVHWLAAQFAAREGSEPARRPTQVYDAGLLKQVKRFQVTEGIKPDGIVGPLTIIRLNASSKDGSPSLSVGDGNS